MADKNKNILWISLISRARGSPSRPTDRIMCLIWRKDFMFSAVVTWDFQVGCTEEMSSFCPKGRSTSITSKYLHFFQPYANKTVITDSFVVRFVASSLLAEFWLDMDLPKLLLSLQSHLGWRRLCQSASRGEVMKNGSPKSTKGHCSDIK